VQGPLASNDPVTQVLNGGRPDYVPVAPCYELLGALEFYRMELRWRAWRRRLESAGLDLLPVSYQDYLKVEIETYVEMLDTAYPRPAWLGLPRNSAAEEMLGYAVVGRGDELFWLSPDGGESWIPPNRQAQQEAVVAERLVSWADLWDRSNSSASAVHRAASRPVHVLDPLPEPEGSQAAAVAKSQRYDVAHALVERYLDQLPLYTGGSSPYNGLMDLFGFQDLMYALVEQPKLVHRILENRLPRRSARLAAERRLGITLMFVEECMASADILSPRMYQEFVFPYTRQALQLYEDMGFRTVLYFSGNLMPFLKYLKDLPFTALACEEDRKAYGIDLAEVRRALGPDRVLFGNVDALFLEKASDQEVLEEVRRQIAVAGPENFIISVGSPMTPGTSLERVRLFCESTRLI